MNLIGRTIGRYRIQRRLGAGGMGEVYLAEHEDILRKAAIKVLNPDVAARGDMLQRFFNEARAAALARHPSIIDIYEYGQSEVGAYLIMEYLEGQTLAERLRRGFVFPVARTAALVSRVASALPTARAVHAAPVAAATTAAAARPRTKALPKTTVPLRSGLRDHSGAGGAVQHRPLHGPARPC